MAYNTSQEFYFDDDGIEETKVKLDEIKSNLQLYTEDLRKLYNQILESDKWIGNGKDACLEYLQYIIGYSEFLATGDNFIGNSTSSCDHTKEMVEALKTLYDSSITLEKGGEAESVSLINKLN